jgi:membrane protease YdiL (CAAX protease family)
MKAALKFLKKHPLQGYFILVFGLVWLWEIPLYGLMDYWGGYVLFVVIFSPSVIGIVMAFITKGSWGYFRLIEKCMQWRIGIIWYLIALLVTPILFFITVLSMPGASTAFQLPNPSFIWTYLSALVFGFFGSAIIEELGWRGFALPRLQERYGPLFGTLILGILWATWYIPSWFLTSRGVQGNNLIEIGIPFLKYAGSVLGSAFVYTWLFNRSNGSLFLSILFHASLNMTFSKFPSAFFPSLFEPDTFTHLFSKIGFLPVAILVIILTRGRLGYEYYQENRA